MRCMKEIVVNRAISLPNEMMYLNGENQTVWVNYDFSVPKQEIYKKMGN